MTEGTIKLDTKNVLFFPCIFVYAIPALNLCIDRVNVVCLRKVVIIVWVSCWYLSVHHAEGVMYSRCTR